MAESAARDYPCQVLVQTLRAEQSPRLGSGVVVRAQPNEAAPALYNLAYPEKGRIKRSRVHVTVSGKAWFGMFEERRKNYVYPWLLFSFYTTHDDASHVEHSEVLRNMEPAGDMYWTTQVPFSLVWGYQHFYQVNSTLSGRTVKMFEDIYGALDSDAFWLAKRLLPHRWGGCLRMITETHFQLWVALFQE